ncbi:P-loop containing nucleoside triphosphate hydrolase protein [Obba rivulosa]|uniref:RNA helicase n=1 Tax=Obba rivulosa TaxID=1052685 RepID=A0A8E2AUJ2_9APHY|nr:P-loop containing nucleoside triphosphate hydrolase protein [Obba rivulosa]
MFEHLSSLCPSSLYDGACTDSQCTKGHDAKFCETCLIICAPASGFNLHLQTRQHHAKLALVRATTLLKCTICNVTVAGAGPWGMHVAGQTHRKKASKRGTSTEVIPVDPRIPNAQERRCVLCQRNIGKTQWQNHLQSHDHRRFEKVAAYKALYERAEQDKNTVSVSHADGVDFGTIDTAQSRNGVTIHLTLRTNSSTSRIGVKSVNAVTKLSTVSVFSATAPLKGADSTLTANRPITLPVQFRHGQLGQYQGHVEIVLEDVSQRRFVIVRQLKAAVGDTTHHEILKPQAPYQKRKRAPWRKGRPFVPGCRPPAMSAVPWVKKLRPAKIPIWLSSILSGHPSSDMKEAIRGKIPKTFNLKTHGDTFKMLLWVEEFKTDDDLRVYDMEDVQFTKEGGLYKMRVPGLAEKRPSVIVGDRIEVQPAQATSGRCFEGWVHVVRLNDICVGFSTSFKPAGGQRFNVRFQLNRIPLRRQHQALNAPGLKRVLFPEVVDASSQVMPAAAPSSRLFNALLRGNPEQLRAISAIKQLKPGAAPYIVFGPPGTGKTSTISEGILQILAQDEDARILACAPSNSAADEILSRLKTQLDTNTMFRFNAVFRDQRTVSEEVLQYSYRNPEGVFSIPDMQCLTRFRVIVSTCVSAAFAYGIGLRPGYFSHIFVDEAAQATEAEVMAAMKWMAAESTRIVLSGDPKQLGPIIRSNIARDLGLGKSYLERLMERPVYNDPAVRQKTIIKLLKNYRSHKAILNFPNDHFYDSELQPCGSSAVINAFIDSPILVDPKFPVIFHAITSKDDRDATSPSYFNIDQATLVKDYVTRLLQEGSTGAVDIGVITPYSAQAKKIRQLLKGVADDTDVRTVEAFQGQERRVIIVSTVRSTRELLTHDIKHALGFVANPRRFNVAVTRAQALLIVIGDPSVLSIDPLWRAFMNYVFNKGGWGGDAPGWDTHAPVDESGDYVQEILQAAVQDMDEFARRVEQLVLEGAEAEEGEDGPWREAE